MIYTPRCAIDMLFHPLTRSQANRMVCTKIDFRGFEISISMDSSHTTGDLTRSDIRVYTNPGSVPGVDCTSEFLAEGETMLVGDGETLHRVMMQIAQM